MYVLRAYTHKKVAIDCRTPVALLARDQLARVLNYGEKFIQNEKKLARSIFF